MHALFRFCFFFFFKQKTAYEMSLRDWSSDVCSSDLSSRAACYAVLASLSGRYPPLEGRSPTCYSPVCHSTYPLRGFRVRLACVRHAASVDSEPGSNSQVKVVRLHPLGLRRNSFNA